MDLTKLLGDDDRRKAVDTTRSALDQAREGQQDEGALGNLSRSLVEKVLAVGIDGLGKFDSAATVAADAQRGAKSPDAAVNAIIKKHTQLAAVEGFLTSLGGFFTMPVSLPANVAGFYVLATRMTAAIAAVRGHDLNDPAVRTAVMLTLVGSDADDILAKAGAVLPASKMTALAAKNLSSSALMVVNKAIGFRLLRTAGGKTLFKFGRAVPLVGGGIGAALDAWLISRIATNARREFGASA